VSEYIILKEALNGCIEHMSYPAKKLISRAAKGAQKLPFVTRNVTQPLKFKQCPPKRQSLPTSTEQSSSAIAGLATLSN